MRKAFLLLALLGLTNSLWAADPIVGTWKLNIEKSKFPPGRESRRLKEEIMSFKELGKQYEVTFTQTRADGSINTGENLTPRQGGIIENNEANTEEGSYMVWTVISPHESYSTRLQKGRQVQVSRFVISKDGKTMQQTMIGTDPQGDPFVLESVWDKQ